MTNPAAAIESKRLVMLSLTPLVLETFLAGDLAAAGQVMDCHIPEDYPLNRMPLARRLKQIRADATEQPWLLRAIIDRQSKTMIGHIGFHSRPRPDDLAEIAPDGVELGYTIHPSFRRKGYATEAALSLMHWAYQQHSQRCLVLSISPENLPSTAMAKSLGLIECGSKMDKEDGLEIFYVRRFETWPMDWAMK